MSEYIEKNIRENKNQSDGFSQRESTLAITLHALYIES